MSNWFENWRRRLAAGDVRPLPENPAWWRDWARRVLEADAAGIEVARPAEDAGDRLEDSWG
jgi:hypothetical protein